MRIPYEGMLAALALRELPIDLRPPLLVSIWGNDFTLHARANPWMARLTSLVLEQADALHTDCQRDQRLAHEWGYATHKPAIVLPGGGGVQADLFYPPVGETTEERERRVINPRGMRAYVRNDAFFRRYPTGIGGPTFIPFHLPYDGWRNPGPALGGPIGAGGIC